MVLCFRIFPAVLLALALLAPPAAWSQQVPAPVAAQAARLPQDQLDALLAPIALYPDQLVAQVLMASTYPLEVVEAARFLQQNPSLKGPALDQALLGRAWDPSVQSLAAFPQVLAMMHDRLEWTQQLGDAFLANEPQVMETVQSLRARAQSAGNLQSTPQQTVVVQEKYITIEPAQPQVLYVPVYDPMFVYGPWWAPAYPPWYWYPPPIYGYPPLGGAIAAGILWGTAWAITANNWGWSHPNWRGRNININVYNNNNIFINNRPQYRDRYGNGQWQHQPEHRRGVAYRDPTTRERYQRPNNAGISTREIYRGYDNARPAPRPAVDRPSTGNAGGANAPRPNVPATRPAGAAPAPRPATPAPRPGYDRPVTQPAPVFNTRESRPQVQMESNRGQASRHAMTRPVPPPQTQYRPQAQSPNRPQAPAPSRPQAQSPGGPQAQSPSRPQAPPQSMNRPAQGSANAPGGRGGAPQRGQP